MIAGISVVVVGAFDTVEQLIKIRRCNNFSFSDFWRRLIRSGHYILRWASRSLHSTELGLVAIILRLLLFFLCRRDLFGTLRLSWLSRLSWCICCWSWLYLLLTFFSLHKFRLFILQIILLLILLIHLILIFLIRIFFFSLFWLNGSRLQFCSVKLLTVQSNQLLILFYDEPSDVLNCCQVHLIILPPHVRKILIFHERIAHKIQISQAWQHRQFLNKFFKFILRVKFNLILTQIYSFEHLEAAWTKIFNR